MVTRSLFRARFAAAAWYIQYQNQRGIRLHYTFLVFEAASCCSDFISSLALGRRLEPALLWSFLGIARCAMAKFNKLLFMAGCPQTYVRGRFSPGAHL